ncbi:MAG: hypothetical protein HY074_04920 [Deltaproteobacteria bacterium]|nr:hypothetical protein [Deltaproteobacteria bacterium]
MKATTRTVIFSAALIGCAVAIAAPKAARAAGPEDVVIGMGLDMVKSIAGMALKDKLFPAQSLDYDRIRKDMEQVTKQAIISADLDRLLGHIAGASQNARTSVFHGDAVASLEGVRMGLVADLAGITQGQFQVPGIGNYVMGAQIEMSILAAMLERSPPEAHKAGVSASLECKRDCVINIMRARVDEHAKHLAATTPKIVAEARAAAVASVGTCWEDYEDVTLPNGGWKRLHYGWLFQDGARGYKSRLYKNDKPGCSRERGEYIQKFSDEAAIRALVDTRWMYVARASWSKALVLADPATYTAETRSALLELMEKYYPHDSKHCAGAMTMNIKNMTRPDGKPSEHFRACNMYKNMVRQNVAFKFCNEVGGTAEYLKLADAVGCK